jgi:hypothetical protein
MASIGERRGCFDDDDDDDAEEEEEEEDDVFDVDGRPCRRGRRLAPLFFPPVMRPGAAPADFGLAGSISALPYQHHTGFSIKIAERFY